MNSLLYGHSPKEHLVGVQQLNDRIIRLYSRTNGKIQHEDVEFFPFFFLSDPGLLEGFPKQFWLKELSGNLFFRHIAAFSRWGDMWEAVHYSLSAYNKSAATKISHYYDLDLILLRPDPVNQFLAQSGNTLFKGMEFNELHRMQIDVQRARHLPAVDPKPAVERIERIVLSDTTGWYDSLESEDASQEEMLGLLVSIIRERDPDILEGHNLNSQIMPVLVTLAEQRSIDFALGRDGSGVKHIAPRQPYRSGDGEMGFYQVAGRYLVDTQRLAEAYDASMRSFENLTLDYLARYFGFDSDVQTQPAVPTDPIDAKRKTRKSKQPPLENVKRVRRLSEVLLLSHFYLAQICPLGLGTLMRTGSAAKIESLLFREYLRQKHSLPKPGHGSQSQGGYTDIFYTGIFNNVLHADVEALYPSIIISQKIKPQSDVLDIFIPILTELTERRLTAKRNFKQASTPQLQSRLNALQSALKILINSFYGYLAYARAHFNDYEQADHITTLGQTFLRSIIEQARLFNAQVLEVDTDGLYFIPPDNVAGEEKENSFMKRLASSLPPGINLLTAGRYKKMLSYKRKNYALMDSSGRISIKGSSLVSRSMELFARRYIEKCIECLLLGDIEMLHRTYIALHRRIVAHQWSAREFCKSETLKENFETYEEELKAGRHAPSAPMEAAKKASIYPRSGLVILYYVTGSDPNVRIADNCRIVEEWDSNLPDENTAYYLSRLAEYSAKFRDFFTPPDYEKIFSTEDLFGFSPAGINILNRELQPQKPDFQAGDADDDFPIWLGDPSA
jgi:DNA polymerase, archaea type